ncbi:hypothetical protein D3C87_1998240 [compost metagenome]
MPYTTVWPTPGVSNARSSNCVRSPKLSQVLIIRRFCGSGNEEPMRMLTVSIP